MKNLSYSILVHKTIKNFISKSGMGFSVLQKVWFDGLQGKEGVIKKHTEIDEKNATNFNMESPITLCDGTQIVVNNCWGEKNFLNFISHANLLGYKIEVTATKLQSIKYNASNEKPQLHDEINIILNLESFGSNILYQEVKNSEIS